MVLKTYLFIKNIFYRKFCKESETFLMNKCVFNTIYFQHIITLLNGFNADVYIHIYTYILQLNFYLQKFVSDIAKINHLNHLQQNHTRRKL